MNATIVIDLGFGDAGKGSLVDYLVRRNCAHTVIRFNGGAQAAHNVVLPDGRHHTFSQFGSGTFVPGVRTHLSRFMLLDPVALTQEERHLQTLGIHDAFDRISVDRHALVVTPFQKAANRLRELARGDGRHGSCGMGIGETMADQLADQHQVLHVGDLCDRLSMQIKLRHLQERKRHEISQLTLPDDPAVDREWELLNAPSAATEFSTRFNAVANHIAITDSSSAILSAAGNIIFEGAQGVLLDEWFGFHPFTTWSTTTFANALTLLNESHYPGKITRIGATRAYMARHGPGPLVTEALEIKQSLTEPHNGTNPWQRSFRMGWLDLVMLRYALRVAGGVDQLALTCLDHLPRLKAIKICQKYHDAPKKFFKNDDLQMSPLPDLDHQEKMTNALLQCHPCLESLTQDQLPQRLKQQLNVPVGILSYGPTHKNKFTRAITQMKMAEVLG